MVGQSRRSDAESIVPIIKAASAWMGVLRMRGSNAERVRSVFCFGRQTDIRAQRAQHMVPLSLRERGQG
jgi:hypothetical protein